jgi:arylsulfatase A-like enzyme
MKTSTFSVSRRHFLQAAAGVCLARGGRAESTQPPNILVILADDQGWGDLSVNGNTNLSTPNVDSLARDGALFDRFFVCAVCAPTRAEFLTGRYHARGGVRGVSVGEERLNLDEGTIAESFRQAGYATGAFGKWHSGSQFPYHPNARGFDEYYGFTSGHWGLYFDTELDHNGNLVRGSGYIADDLTNHAMEFITEHRDRPFFCYLPFNTPHSPMEVPDRFFEKFSHMQPKMRARNPELESVPDTRAALAMCENIDWNVGRVLAKLDELKIAENTIVIYFSDNGPANWRWNGGMKGKKGSVDEGGLRAPFMIRWPGHIPAGTRIPQIAGAIDIFPTLTDLAGIPTANRKPLDGKSLKPLLLGKGGDWPDRMIFSLQGKKVSVRTQQYRLDQDGKLFDMVADPMQDRDVATEKPDVATRLRTAQAQWRAEMLPKVGPDDRPFTVGYGRITRLPARDGVAGGGVKRSANPPNSSYFTHWTSLEDRITWHIEVGRAGLYDADLYYTCPALDVGARVELGFLGQSVSSVVRDAWDPPPLGAAFDRVPRIESYVKNFRPLRLGTVRLEKGTGELTLRALEIPGKQVADVRYVIFTYRG